MAEISRLPGPIGYRWDWQMRAACRDKDSTMFFHPEGERGLARQHRDRLAIAVCSTCPVIEQCKQHALSVREPYGVWGGLTEEARTALYAAQRTAC